MTILRHWFKDHRRIYVDPASNEHRPERRRAWSVLGPGQVIMAVLLIALVAWSLYSAHDVSRRFDEQQARTACLRAALRPIVAAAAKLGGGPDLLRAEHAYLTATAGLSPPGSCPR